MLTACWALAGFCRCGTYSIHRSVQVWMHKPRRQQNPVVYLFLQYSEWHSWVSVTISWVWQFAFWCVISSCIWDQLGQTNPKIKADQMKTCFHSRCCHVGAWVPLVIEQGHRATQMGQILFVLTNYQLSFSSLFPCRKQTTPSIQLGRLNWLKF